MQLIISICNFYTMVRHFTILLVLTGVLFASVSKNIIQSNSIDRLLLINVIYFLDPIEQYLQEFKRIIKDDGIILISGKFDATKDFDETVFKNIQLGSLLESLDDYFQVSCEYVDLGEERSQYHAITLKKSK